MAVQLRRCLVPAVARPFRLLALQQREGIAPIVGAGHRRRDRPIAAGQPRHRHPSLRTTAINDAIRNGATMHEVREFAGHADIRTTKLYFERKEEDAEVAARRIQIRLTGSRSQ